MGSWDCSAAAAAAALLSGGKQCQDQMFFMHGALFRARQRMYDVPVAADVLVGGRYPRLPKSIQYCGGDVDPRPTFEV